MMQSQEQELSLDKTGPYRTPADMVETSDRPSKLSAISVLVCLGMIAIVFVVVCIRYAPGFQAAPESNNNSTAITPTVDTERGDIEEPASMKPFIENYGMTRGGAHRIMGDGEVVFVVDPEFESDSEAGGAEGITPSGTKSPYGLWGRLGSRANPPTLQPEVESE